MSISKEQRIENPRFYTAHRTNLFPWVNTNPSTVWKRRPRLPKPAMGEREKARLERRKFHDVKSALKNPAWRTQVIFPA